MQVSSASRTGASSGSSRDAANTIARLQKQLQQLADRLRQIASEDMAAKAKQEITDLILAQMQAIQQQIAAIQRQQQQEQQQHQLDEQRRAQALAQERARQDKSEVRRVSNLGGLLNAYA